MCLFLFLSASLNFTIYRQLSNSNAYKTYTQEEGLILPTSNEIIKQGYSFEGWYDNENFENDSILEIEPGSTGNKKYYAKWEKVEEASDLIREGITNIDWTPYYQNHTTDSLTKKSGYISFYTGSEMKFSNYHTLRKVDLTNYSKLNFYGKIGSLNPSSGHLYVSTSSKTDSTNNKYSAICEGLVESLQLRTTLQTYEMDISNLKGAYYIGVFGSSRTIQIYDVWLSN